jgi:malonyl-CoA O-methyltransferase
MPTLNTDPSVETAVPGLDATAARRWRQLPRTDSPWLHEEVASRMAERLQWFRDKPASWLHWEPVLGGLQGHRRVREWLPQARCHVAAEHLPKALQATQDPAARSWNPATWLRGKTPASVEEDTRVGMVWANMQLHLEPRPLALLQRWHAHIETEGFLMFSCLGPDTLRELRSIYARAGWHEPTHAFTDMHDWGDMLVHSGFAEPVMDMERITLSYSGAQPLLQDLRLLGRNLHQDRHPGLRSRAWREALCQRIEADVPRDPQGRLLLTLEIIYGHAFKPVPRVPVASTTTVSVDEMRSLLRSPRP